MKNAEWLTPSDQAKYNKDIYGSVSARATSGAKLVKMMVMAVGLYTMVGWLSAGIVHLASPRDFAPSAVVVDSRFFPANRVPVGPGNGMNPLPPSVQSATCPQASPLNPSKHQDLEQQLVTLYTNRSYRMAAYRVLGGAIQIP